MAIRSTVLLTTGVAGSGKSYVRCARFLVDEFLPDTDGVHYSNFPVFPEKIAALIAPRLKVEPGAIIDRIKVIPDEALQTWISGESGPWDYFRDLDLQNTHIAIDEIHNFCGKNTKRKTRARWQSWLGEIRHRGATVEFISQSPQKIAREIEYEAGVRLSLINSADRRDPFFGVTLGDWYELRAKFFTGELEPRVWQVERRNVDGKWLVQSTKSFLIEAHYFQFYDSYSAPHMGGRKASAPKYEFEKRSRIGLLWWFSRRNWWPIGSRSCVGVLLFLFFFGGLGNWAFDRFLALFGALYRGSRPQPTETVVRKKVPKRVPAELVEFNDILEGRSKPRKVQQQGWTQRPEVGSPVKHGTVSPNEVPKQSQPNPPLFSAAPNVAAASKAAVPTIAAIWSCCVQVSDGRRLKVHSVFVPGVLIEDIDFERRKVVLTDGRVLGVGDEVVPAAVANDVPRVAPHSSVWSAAE